MGGAVSHIIPPDVFRPGNPERRARLQDLIQQIQTRSAERDALYNQVYLVMENHEKEILDAYNDILNALQKPEGHLVLRVIAIMSSIRKLEPQSNLGIQITAEVLQGLQAVLAIAVLAGVTNPYLAPAFVALAAATVVVDVVGSILDAEAEYHALMERIDQANNTLAALNKNYDEINTGVDKLVAFVNDIVQKLVYVSYFETGVNLRDAKYTRENFKQDFEKIQPQLIILRNEFVTLKEKIDSIVTMFNDRVPYPTIAKYANHSEGFVITAHIYYLFSEQKKTVKEVMEITGRSKTEVEAAQIASVLLDHPDWSIDRVKESIAGKPTTVQASHMVATSNLSNLSAAPEDDVNKERLGMMVDVTKTHLNDLFFSILQI
ncbi:3494_t:CDS:2 [Paraglomus occultum]|uniref:3494_t:CDS:1 n=1 Tax=Paraglomus occultum TaxID=144539 RepID=A0A9N9G4N1_9GLOM|nr:3494_t:CDS:2 [Paraglomus occultum]